MKLSIRKLLCLLLALCLVAGCLTGCAGSSRSSDDEKEEDDDPAAKAREDLDSYELNGLTYYLSEDFADDVDYDDDYTCHSDGGDVTIEVSCGPMSDVADEDIKTSKEFAQFFMDMIGDMYDESEMDSKYDITYILGTYEETTTIIGFYVEDDYGWIIMVTAEGDVSTDELIDMVTLGEIDKDFDSSDYITYDDPDYDYEEEEYVDEEYEIEVPTSSDTFTVHAYVPDAWGYPCCWAWSSTTGENVFSAWPGEYMTWEEGYYYTMEIPAWADYVIVNGNDGTIQTDDEPVEAGSDIWIIIGTAGDYYGVFFEEPDAATLSEYGY